MLWGEVDVSRCGESLGFSSMVMRNVGLYNNPTTQIQMFLLKQSELFEWSSKTVLSSNTNKTNYKGKSVYKCCLNPIKDAEKS